MKKGESLLTLARNGRRGWRGVAETPIHDRTRFSGVVRLIGDRQEQTRVSSAALNRDGA